MSTTNSRTPAAALPSLRGRPIASHSTKRPASFALTSATATGTTRKTTTTTMTTKSGRETKTLAVKSRIASVTSASSSCAISAMARKKENVACAPSKGKSGLVRDRLGSVGIGSGCGASGSRVGYGGTDDGDGTDDGAGKGVVTGRRQAGVSALQAAGERSPTKLPVPSAVRNWKQEERSGYDVGGTCAVGRRRRVGGAVSNVTKVDVGVDAQVSEPQTSSASGLRKIEDAKINAAAGRALLRRSSVRDGDGENHTVVHKAAAPRKHVIEMENTERCLSRSGRLSHGSDRRRSARYSSRLSGSGSRTSSARGTDDPLQFKASAAPGQARRLSYRQSSLRVSSGDRHSVNGIASTSANVPDIRLRNVSLVSVASANEPNALQKTMGRTLSTRIVGGTVDANPNDPPAKPSRAKPSRPVQRSGTIPGIAVTIKEQRPTARKKPEFTDKDMPSSLELARLRAETLQLRLLHAPLASNSFKRSKRLDKLLRQDLSDTESAFRRMRSNEQIAQSLINRIALHSWSYGIDGDCSQTDNIALLITILDEFPALLSGDERRSCVDEQQHDDRDSDDGSQYARLANDFNHWTQHVRQVWRARGENGNGLESFPTTPTCRSDRQISRVEGAQSAFADVVDSSDGFDDDDDDAIHPMPASWHAGLAVLSRKINILGQSVDELDAAPDGSTLALVLQRCNTFLVRARQELTEMKELEEMVVNMEKGSGDEGTSCIVSDGDEG